MEQDLVFDGRNIPVADAAKIMGKIPTVHTTCYGKQVITYWISV